MKALLALEDGFVLEGRSFTGPITGAGGEVIFNTGMTGYQEVLTDPSYCGQMVCMTWPLIGNAGINPEDWESTKVHCSGLLVKECCKEPSNWQSTESLPDFLIRHQVPGVEDLDTRALTLHIRKHGALRGVISTEDLNPASLIAKALQIPPMLGQNLVPKVAPKVPYAWKNKGYDTESGLPQGQPMAVALSASGAYAWEHGKIRVLVYDYGIKWNILRNLAAQDMDLLLVPPTFSPEQAKATGAQAVFLSNGPGDPSTMTAEIAIITALVEAFPVAGICLGHQLLGHALGGTTKKLKFGHHGCNHPVKDLESGRIEISSQNHGFHVLNDHVVVTHINLNDQTVEGFRHPTKPVIAVQHHPEAAAGPKDCQTFFGHFKKMVVAQA